MTQGWNIDAAADTITFIDAPPSGTNNIIVTEYATAEINATSVWALGAWSAAYGYPSAVEFYDDRLGFAATVSQPQTMWFSRTGDYSMFGKSTPVLDDDAFSATMNARQLNKINALIPKQDLLVATTGGVWKVSGGDTVALTPTTVTARPQPSVGANELPPLDVGETAIYQTYLGGEVRDLSYVFESDGYAGSDLTAFAGHLVRGYSLDCWAWCPQPWSAAFVARSDGTLLTLTYKREHQVVAWARHDLSGGACLQAEGIPEGDVTGTYLCVKREVNGQTVQYIERLTDVVNDDLREEVGVDCSLSYDGRNKSSTTLSLSGGAAPGEQVTVTASASIFSASNVGDEVVIDYDGIPCRIRILAQDSGTVVRGISSRALKAGDLSPGTNWALAVDTLSGLDHLEGETVLVGGDGMDLGTFLVSGGSITGVPPAVISHVGLAYDSDFESLDMAIIGNESVANRRKLIREVGVLLYNTRTIKASGSGYAYLDELQARNVDMSMSVPPELRTEWVTIPVDGQWGKNPRVYIRHSGPYRARVLAIEPKVEFGT